MGARLGIGVCLALALPACSLLLGEGYAGDADPTVNDSGAPRTSDDGGVVLADSAPPTPTGDAAEAPEVDAGPSEILRNAAFEETGGAGCGAHWNGDGLSQPPGRFGNACRVCRTSQGKDWYGVEQVFTPPLGPGRYRISGYIKVSGAPFEQCEIGINVTRQNGSRQVYDNNCNVANPGWQYLTATADIAENETIHDFYIGAFNATGLCLETDDVTLTRL